MKKLTFEGYLQEQHAKQYIGLDDEMPDSFSDWLCNLDPDDWIQLGDQWGLKRAIISVDKLLEITNE